LVLRARCSAPPRCSCSTNRRQSRHRGRGGTEARAFAFKERGATIIVITHRTTVLEVVDALMVLRGGQLEMIGPPDAVYDHLKQTSH